MVNNDLINLLDRLSQNELLAEEVAGLSYNKLVAVSSRSILKTPLSFFINKKNSST